MKGRLGSFQGRTINGRRHFKRAMMRRLPYRRRRGGSGEVGTEEIFVVALHALDGGVDDFYGGAVLLEDAIAHTLDGILAGFGIADDATLADVFAANLELRFDEDDGGALPGFCGGT